MSNTNDQLSRRDQLLIESYKEQTAAGRHEDNLFYRFTTIILPLSIAALAVPYVQKDVPDLLATIGGLTLMAFWAISCQIIDIKSNIRFSIINKIEERWDVLGHKDFTDIRKNTYGKRASHFLRSQLLRRYMFWVYLGIVGGLTLYRTMYCMWSAQWALGVIILPVGEIIVTLIFAGVSGRLVALAMRKARKEICVEGEDKTDSAKNDR